MRHTIQHPLTEEQAKRAVEAAWAEYSRRFERYDPQLQWRDGSRAKLGFRAKGVTLGGQLELQPGAITLELDVPFLLKPFAGKAIAVVEREIQRWIAHVQSSG
jgi:hypothetical protein